MYIVFSSSYREVGERYRTYDPSLGDCGPPEECVHMAGYAHIDAHRVLAVIKG